MPASGQAEYGSTLCVGRYACIAKNRGPQGLAYNGMGVMSMVFWRRDDRAAVRPAGQGEEGRAGGGTARGAEGTERGQPGASLEASIQRIGREILTAARDRRAGGLSRRSLSDRLMQWAMHDPAFKVQMLRFVDVFPMLRGSRQIDETLREYLSQPGVRLPAGSSLGLAIGSVLKDTLAASVRSRILAMGERFILAADTAGAMGPLGDLRSRGMGFSVDLLGEVCVSDAEARAYQRRVS